jgi:hypothetical protein
MYTSYSYTTFLTRDPKMDSIIPRVLFACGQTTFFHTLKDTYLINAADILVQ